MLGTVILRGWVSEQLNPGKQRLEFSFKGKQQLALVFLVESTRREFYHPNQRLFMQVLSIKSVVEESDRFSA